MIQKIPKKTTYPSPIRIHWFLWDQNKIINLKPDIYGDYFHGGVGKNRPSCINLFPHGSGLARLSNTYPRHT